MGIAEVAYVLAKRAYKLVQNGTVNTNDYNVLSNKPSINGVYLKGSLSSEDLQILNEDSVNNLIDNKTEHFATASQIPENISELNNDEGFIKSTSYASKTQGGTVKIDNLYDIAIGEEGQIYPNSLTLPQYNNKSSYSFISKGTLENVLSDRIITRKDGAGDKFLNDKGEYVKLQSSGNSVELTEEHLTGEIFNGKPIYEKLFTLYAGNSINSARTLLMTTDYQINRIISIGGVGKSLLGTTIGIGSSSSNVNLKIWRNSTNEIREMHDNSEFNSADIYLILKYTKITD